MCARLQITNGHLRYSQRCPRGCQQQECVSIDEKSTKRILTFKYFVLIKSNRYFFIRLCAEIIGRVLLFLLQRWGSWLNVIGNGVLGPHGVCVYIRESNANLRDYYYKKFSVHAANAKLPANSVFAIYANDATVEVTMSDDQSKTSKFDAGFTFLSEEAAEALGITEDGTKIDCKILSPYRRKFVTFLAHAYYYFALITPVVGVVGIVVSALMKYVATI